MFHQDFFFYTRARWWSSHYCFGAASENAFELKVSEWLLHERPMSQESREKRFFFFFLLRTEIPCNKKLNPCRRALRTEIRCSTPVKKRARCLTDIVLPMSTSVAATSLWCYAQPKTAIKFNLPVLSVGIDT